MDQNKTNDPEKRNWREKLGIGTNGASKELPKISDDFKKTAPSGAPVVAAPRPAAPRIDTSAKPAVRPAPMAPRAGTPMVSRANPKPTAPASPDKLAERLRSQRDASTKLAEQRVQVARQRADVPPPAATVVAKVSVNPAAMSNVNAVSNVNIGPKPKFTFAEDEANAVRQVPTARPAAVPPRPMPQQTAQPAAATPRPASFQPQPNPPPALAPSRPSLGASPQPFSPRPQQPPGLQAGAAPGQNFSQQPTPGYPPQGYGQATPGYRPIDPATGYPQQTFAPYGQPGQSYQPQARPPYVPNQRFNPPPPQAQQGYMPPNAGPRLSVPQRPGLNANFTGAEQPAFNAPPTGMRQPPRVARPADEYDEEQLDDGLFDEPAPSLQRPAGRRPTSVDYQQAYRDAEAGFEDEMPRSKLPWILPGILLVGVVLAGLLVWAYQTQIKPMMNGGQQATTTQSEVPVVPAPPQPARTQPETTQPANAANTSRKQIYDRIVGDQEVLGGQMVPTEQVPAQQDGANAAPQPADGTGDAAPSQGGDAVPLPIPPPPGDNTQGALPSQPEDPNKQSAEIITPAASESLAAVAVPAPGESTAIGQPTAASVATAAEPQVAEAATTVADEQNMPEKPKTVVPKKSAATIKKLKQLPKKQMASLGAKPVVLVPASKKAKAAAIISQTDTDVTTAQADTSATDGGLYGNNFAVDTPATNAAAVATPKKKRTLADLFQGNGTNDAAAQTASNTALEPIVAETPKAIAPVAKPKPAPVQQASLVSNGYVAQLASFRSNAEASAEFARLKSKYGSTLGGLSPVISKADVAGSTRYRLAVGPFASRDAANAMCSKLFAAGERDCLVRN